MSAKASAVVAGVGSGNRCLGRPSLCQIVSRCPFSSKPREPQNLVQEINSSRRKAIGIPTDISSEDYVKAAFERIEEEYDDALCAAAIYIASSAFVRKPFLEMRVGEFDMK